MDPRSSLAPTLEELSGYFTPAEWKAMLEYEKLRCLNELDNYRIKLELDMNPEEPEFIKAKKNQNVGTLTENNKTEKSSIDKGFLFSVQEAQSQTGTKAVEQQEETEAVKNNARPGHSLNLNVKHGKNDQEFKQLQIHENVATAMSRSLSKLRNKPFPYNEGNSCDGNKFDANENVIQDNSDSWMFCDLCQKNYWDGCKKHALLKVVDTPVPWPEMNGRAVKTLPKELIIYQSKGSVTFGVWTRVFILKGARLGPYEGKNLKETVHPEFSWEIIKFGKRVHYVDGYWTWSSNWMRYVKIGRTEDGSNLVPFQFKSQIYYKASKDIEPFTELVVYRKEKIDPKVTNCGTGSNQTSSGSLAPYRPSNPGRKPINYRIVMIKCCLCNYRTPNKSLLDIHMKEHLITNNLSCNLCHQSAYEDTSRSGDDVGPYKCPRCDYWAMDQGYIEAHQQREHARDGWESCSFCSYQAENPVLLNIHRTKHLNVGGKPYKCQRCDYWAMDDGFIHAHRQIEHSSAPFCCMFCPYQTSNRSALEAHKTKHTATDNGQCPRCSSWSRQERYLKTHH